jgi:hypothetical protein
MDKLIYNEYVGNKKIETFEALPTDLRWFRFTDDTTKTEILFYSRDIDAPPDVIIPDTVTSIGMSAFENSPITSITIPDTVTSIGEYAFRSCGQLSTVNINQTASIISIGKAAFAFSKKITSITIPNKVTSIGEDAFFSCEELSTVYFHGIFPTIGTDAFTYIKLGAIGYYYSKNLSTWKDIKKINNLTIELFDPVTSSSIAGATSTAGTTSISGITAVDTTSTVGTKSTKNVDLNVLIIISILIILSGFLYYVFFLR